MIEKIGFLVLIIGWMSCSKTKDLPKTLPTSGIIKYSITIDAKDDIPVTTESFGNSATVHFNEKYLHLKKDNGQEAEDIFQIIDLETGTETNYIKFMEKKFALEMTKEMLPPVSELVFHEEKKMIAGLECKRATARMGEETVEVWFTDKIKANFCPYVDAKGFALEYTLAMPYGKVTYTASDVKLNTTNPKLLTPPLDYKKVTMMELQRELSSLSSKEMYESFLTKGKEVPTFTAKDIDGNSVDLESLRGKVVLINFWFINCPPCRAEIPDLNKLKAEFEENKDVVFLSITFDKKEQVNKFLKKIPFEFQNISNGMSIIEKYKIMSYPTTVVVDKEGKVFNSKKGGSFNIKEELKKMILGALKK